MSQTETGSPSLAGSREAAVTALDRVAARRDAWVRTPIPERMGLLRACLTGVQEVADEWIDRACRARQIDPRSPLAGEEWMSGVMTTVRGTRLLVEALAEGGQPRPRAILRRPDGRTVARVFPRTARDRIVYLGMTAEVWIEPGKPASQGRIYKEKAEGRYPPGRVALVLGAGNISSIGPLDVLTKLVVEDQVAVLKMNPVNDYLAPLFERVFRSLIEAGYVAIVTGGKDVGALLTRHPVVDSIHLTGSDRTHDTIVWGASPDERARRKAAGEPLLDKEFTSELGCVTPVLIVPGPWSMSDLAFQARQVASMVAHNASFNCTAGKVMVLARGWPQRADFLEHLSDALARMPARYAYYPGAEDRYRAVLDRYPQSRVLGRRGPGAIPWTLIPDVPPIKGEYALSTEAFCGVLAEVTLEGQSTGEFVERAVAFANEMLWGTLSCVILVDDRSARERRDLVEQAIADLRHGTIGVNAWTGANFSLGVTTWGAYPGHRLEDIGSGRGVVHNACLFDYPEKSVIRAPFRLRPTPVWFADHRTLADVGRLAAQYEAKPSWSRLIPLGLAAMRG